MSSYKKGFNSESEPDHYISDEIKMNRRSTKAISDQSRNMDRFEFAQEFEECPQPPSPVQSSQQGSSVQVKYLSYLAQVIDSAPEGEDQSEIEFYYHNAEYWHVIYQAAIYVRKDAYRTDIDDNLIISQFQEYLKPGRIHPEHSNEIGQELLKNGYFLCAYAISLARKRKSAFIFRYLMQHFQKEFTLETNQEEFLYLLENYVHTDRVEEVLHLNLNETLSQQNGHNFIVQRNLTPGNNDTPRNSRHLKPNRISYQQYLANQDSERSHTIIIEDDSEMSIQR